MFYLPRADALGYAHAALSALQKVLQCSKKLHEMIHHEYLGEG